MPLMTAIADEGAPDFELAIAGEVSGLNIVAGAYRRLSCSLPSRPRSTRCPMAILVAAQRDPSLYNAHQGPNEGQSISVWARGWRDETQPTHHCL